MAFVVGSLVASCRMAFLSGLDGCTGLFASADAVMGVGVGVGATAGAGAVADVVAILWQAAHDDVVKWEGRGKPAGGVMLI